MSENAVMNIAEEPEKNGNSGLESSRKPAVEKPLMLVVDDVASIRLVVRSLFRSDYRVNEAEDGVDALEFLQENTPDIIITDIDMPRLDGFGLCDQLGSKPEWKEIPVIILSTHDEVANRVRGLEMGAMDFVAKPFDLKELKARVDSVVNRAKEKIVLKEKLSGVSRMLEQKETLLGMSRDELIDSHKQLRDYIKQLTTVSEHKERLMSELQELYLGVIALLVNTLEAKDPYTHNHSRKVADYARGIAVAMKLDEVVIERIEKSALMHDIGKVGISDLILQKNGPLTDPEYVKIKTHPEKGADILRPIHFMAQNLPAIRHHHERFDGKGYPSGLKGKSIPLEARIIAVADTYDAITTDRPYRKRRTHTEAIDEIRNCSSAQFDPVVVEAAVRNADIIFSYDETNDIIR